MAYEQYETVIGLEVHVQLSTRSKAFCGDDTSFGGAPNTQISAVSLGYPGTLPRINRRQVEFAVRLGLALGCEINPRSAFDRKNYFYADLPKGYQITQDRQPICLGGALPIQLNEAESKTIRIHHIHMEEDAGKSMHDADPHDSLIDLNRAGVPLLEVVTEPDLRSAEEVDAFMSGMRQLVRYLDISDGNMEEGSMRCDCNVSVRQWGDQRLGERCEIKNLNSMRYARRAIAFEFRRQVDLLEKGSQVRQQTLHFDPATGRTAPLRDKEDAHDYRYFPEPDLPPVLLLPAEIDAIRKTLPPLPWHLYQSLQDKYGLPAYDANLLSEEREVAEAFLELCRYTKHYKAAANLFINKIMPWRQEENKGIIDFPVSPEALAGFIHLIEAGKISNAIAYQRLLPELIHRPGQSPEALAREMELFHTADENFLEKLVEEVIGQYPDKAATYRKGKKGLIGFFMGEVMKRSRGKAEPRTTNALLRKKLEE